MRTHIKPPKTDMRTHIKGCQEIKEKPNPTSKHSKAYYIRKHLSCLSYTWIKGSWPWIKEWFKRNHPPGQSRYCPVQRAI